MLIDLRKVAPGDLPLAVFEEFIEGNDYAPAMVAALRDHLVHGVAAKDAVKSHGLNATKYKIRLEKLNEDIQRVGRINALLSIDQSRLEEVYELAKTLTLAVDGLRFTPRPIKL